MNANALAKALPDPQPKASTARRKAAGARSAAAAPFNPADLAATLDDDLRLERATEVMRHALANGRLEDVCSAAQAAMPTLEPREARTSVLNLLAQARPMPMRPPEENRLYLMRRLSGAPIGLLRLRDNGRTSLSGAAGASAPTGWTLADGLLELQGTEGRAISRFSLAGEAEGQRLYLGESLVDGTLHLLSEVRCTYSRLRMLDPELHAAFGTLFDTDAMVPVALPATPVVLLATPHTGAERLIKLLNSSGQVLIDGEILHPEHIGLYGGELRSEDAGALYSVRAKDPVYFARVVMGRTHHPDGRGLASVPVRGFTLNPAHSRQTFDWALDDPQVCIINLVRDNLLAEYASILAGGAEHPRRARLPFDGERFRRFVDMKTRAITTVQRRLETRRGPWAEIETGAFTRRNVLDLLAFLGHEDTPTELPAALVTRSRVERTIERFDDPEGVRRALATLGREDWAGC